MKKEIMKRAWRIAKRGAEKFGGKTVEYISEALKIAWREVKAVMIQDEKMNVKYNEWKKYDKHRVYIDIDMSLVEIKNVKENEYGVLRRVSASYYYDVKDKKLYRTKYVGKDLTTATEKVLSYMREKITAKAREIATKFA